MNWGEFKEAVDKELKINKLSKSTKIHLIQCDEPYEEQIRVMIVPKKGLVIYTED